MTFKQDTKNNRLPERIYPIQKRNNRVMLSRNRHPSESLTPSRSPPPCIFPKIGTSGVNVSVLQTDNNRLHGPFRRSITQEHGRFEVHVHLNIIKRVMRKILVDSISIPRLPFKWKPWEFTVQEGSRTTKSKDWNRTVNLFQSIIKKIRSHSGFRGKLTSRVSVNQSFYFIEFQLSPPLSSDRMVLKENC